jgi:hypothetical protein
VTDIGIDTNQPDWQRVAQELFLNDNRLCDYLMHFFLGAAVSEVVEQEAGKVLSMSASRTL